MKKTYRPDYNLSAFLVLCAVWSYLRILLTGLIGRQGTAYACPALELTAICILAFCLPVSMVLERSVRARFLRERYASIRKLMRISTLFSLISGGLMTLIFLLLCRPIALVAGGEAHMYLVIAAISPAFLMLVPMGVMHGYFRGIRMSIPAQTSVLLPAGLMAVLVPVAAASFRGYGESVGALLRDDSYSFVYGAVGAAAGVDGALLLTLLYWLFLMTATFRTRRLRMPVEKQLEPETASALRRSFLRGLFPLCLSGILVGLPVLTDYRILHMAVEPKSLAMAGWGAYYGKTLSLLYGTTALLLIPFSRYPKTMARVRREEDLPTFRSFFGMTMRLLGYVLFPVSFYFISAAKPITAVLSHSPDDAASVSMQICGILVLLTGIGAELAMLYVQLNRVRQLAAACGISWAVQTVLSLLLTRQNEPGITVTAIPQTVSTAMLVLLLLMFRKDELLQGSRYTRAYIFLLISSIAAAIPVYLLSGVLSEQMGFLASSVMLSILYILIYIPVSIVTGAADLRNFDRIPGGNLIVSLADLFGL